MTLPGLSRDVEDVQREIQIRQAMSLSSYRSGITVPVAQIAETKPERQMANFSLLQSMKAQPLRALYGIISGIAASAFINGILGVLLNGALFGVIVFGIVIGIALVGSALHALFVERDNETMKLYGSYAVNMVVDLLRSAPGVSVEDFAKATRIAHKLTADERPVVGTVRRRVLSTIAAIQVAHDRAVTAVGTGDRTPIDRDAATAILRTLDAAQTDIETIDEETRKQDAAIAPPIAEEFSAQMAQLVSGVPRIPGPARPTTTGNARINRIVDNARKALAIDPNMVDDAGARVDALIDTHLPALLERHASASRHGRLEDLETYNADLDTGIEIIRRSVEEGLARIRTAEADKLRTEIAFLRMRRGEDASDLSIQP